MARPPQNRAGRSHLLILDPRTHRAAAILPGRPEEAMRSRDNPKPGRVLSRGPGTDRRPTPSAPRSPHPATEGRATPRLRLVRLRHLVFFGGTFSTFASLPPARI